MQNNFVINEQMTRQIVNELKKIDLCRYEDYVRMVGIVSMLEATLTKSQETPLEEVTTDG